MTNEELFDLVETTNKHKAESTHLEVKAAHNGYIRVGDADLPMTEYELCSYEAFRKHQRDDVRTVARASMQIMDMPRLDMFVSKMRASRPMFSRLSPEQTYEMLNIKRNDILTLAAIMNFGLYPQGYFPQLAITAIVVPGTQIGDVDPSAARFLDNRRIEGDLHTMLDEAMAFCLRNMKQRTIIHPENGHREDRTEYPPNAIREAILNALIHRDYSQYTEGTPIQIDFFSDRLEIHSPGGLYGRLTVEQLGYARPDLRNPSLAVMAETMLGAENRYSGIPTIRREMAAYGLEPPTFENRRGEFVVILRNTCTTTENEEHQSLIEFCRIPRSRQEIADHLGLKPSAYMMRQYVAPLLESGALKMTIPNVPGSKNQRYVASK